MKGEVYKDGIYYPGNIYISLLVLFRRRGDGKSLKISVLHFPILRRWHLAFIAMTMNTARRLLHELATHKLCVCVIPTRMSRNLRVDYHVLLSFFSDVYYNCSL